MFPNIFHCFHKKKSQTIPKHFSSFYRDVFQIFAAVLRRLAAARMGEASHDAPVDSTRGLQRMQKE